MNDILDMLKVLGVTLVTIFVLVGLIIFLIIWSNTYTCPKIADVYNTEYKTVLGSCYLKSDDGQWLREDHFKTTKMINSLNISDASKVMLIKDIEK